MQKIKYLWKVGEEGVKNVYWCNKKEKSGKKKKKMQNGFEHLLPQISSFVRKRGFFFLY